MFAAAAGGSGERQEGDRTRRTGPRGWRGRRGRRNAGSVRGGWCGDVGSRAWGSGVGTRSGCGLRPSRATIRAASASVLTMKFGDTAVERRTDPCPGASGPRSNRPATRRRPARHIPRRIADHPRLGEVQVKILCGLFDHPRPRVPPPVLHAVSREHRLRMIRAIIRSIDMRPACSRSWRRIS